MAGLLGFRNRDLLAKNFLREKQRISTIRVAGVKVSQLLFLKVSRQGHLMFQFHPNLEEGSDAIDLRVVHVQAFSDLFLLEKNC